MISQDSWRYEEDGIRGHGQRRGRRGRGRGVSQRGGYRSRQHQGDQREHRPRGHWRGGRQQGGRGGRWNNDRQRNVDQEHDHRRELSSYGDDGRQPSSHQDDRRQPSSHHDDRRKPSSHHDSKRQPSSHLDDRRQPSSHHNDRRQPSSHQNDRKQTSSHRDDRRQPSSYHDDRKLASSYHSDRKQPSSHQDDSDEDSEGAWGGGGRQRRRQFNSHSSNEVEETSTADREGHWRGRGRGRRGNFRGRNMQKVSSTVSKHEAEDDWGQSAPERNRPSQKPVSTENWESPASTRPAHKTSPESQTGNSPKKDPAGSPQRGKKTLFVKKESSSESRPTRVYSLARGKAVTAPEVDPGETSTVNIPSGGRGHGSQSARSNKVPGSARIKMDHSQEDDSGHKTPHLSRTVDVEGDKGGPKRYSASRGGQEGAGKEQMFQGMYAHHANGDGQCSLGLD